MQAKRDTETTHAVWQCDCYGGHFVSLDQTTWEPDAPTTYFGFHNYQEQGEWSLHRRLKRLVQVFKWALTNRGEHHLSWGEVILSDATVMREMAEILDGCALKWEQWDARFGG
jgi:hypothetical protein